MSLDISSSLSLVGFALLVEEHFVYIPCVVVDPGKLIDDFADGGVFVFVVREEGAFQAFDGSRCDPSDVWVGWESVICA